MDTSALDQTPGPAPVGSSFQMPPVDPSWVGLLNQVRDLRPSVKAYAGIGSRRTPPAVLDGMKRAAFALSWDGWILRSGGADGADTAFESGAAGAAEVFLPWKGFNGRMSTLCRPPPAAFDIAAQFHPSWEFLKPAVRKLMARNVQQVLGADLRSPSAFVLCWTPDGADGKSVATTPLTGGTGQAIRIAAAHGVPVFNIATWVKS